MLDLTQLRTRYNRAWRRAFDLRSLQLAWAVGVVTGLLVLSLMSVARVSSTWAGTALTFLGLFLAQALWLPGGTVLSQLYRLPERLSWSEVFGLVRDQQVRGAYFVLPIVLIYLALWMGLGVFFLLKELPILGAAVATLLAFGPFLLMVFSLGLGAVVLVALFFIPPLLADPSRQALDALKKVVARVKEDPLGYGVAMALGFLPLVLMGALLAHAALWTAEAFVEGFSPVQWVVGGFVVTLPFAALISPCLVFFFNFATEMSLLAEVEHSHG